MSDSKTDNDVNWEEPEHVKTDKAAYEERLQRERDGVATDEDRRLIRAYRKERAADADRKSDDERARQEAENGEEPGARGRNAVGRVDTATGQVIPVNDPNPVFSPGTDQEDADRQRVARSGAGVSPLIVGEHGPEPVDKGGAASVGVSSVTSSDEDENSERPTPQDPRSTAHATGRSSSAGQTGSSSARSTGTSGKAKK